MVSIRKILKGVQGPGIKFAYKTKHMLREILGNLKTKTETSEMVGINEISYDCNEKFGGQNWRAIRMLYGDHLVHFSSILFNLKITTIP